jgi:hypothetical protein
VDGLGEIVWRVLGYGHWAEVIGPEPLRKSVLQSPLAMVRRYQEEAGGCPDRASLEQAPGHEN